MLDTTKKSILELGCFSADDLTVLDTKLKTIQLSRSSFLLQEGQICQSFYYVNAGSIRHYFTREDATEVTINLFVEGDWITDYESFVLQKPSKNTLQAFQKSDLYELTVHDFHALIQASPSFFQLGKLLGKPLREGFTEKTSFQERYELLLSQKPQLIQRFPLKYIASYLGITPETLSRIRRKIT